jgi:hypothetical protein
MMLGSMNRMNRLTITPPEIHGVKITVGYFREGITGGVPFGNWRLRFMMSVPMTVRLNRRVGGEAGLEVGRVSEGSLDVALNILNYYVPPEADGREMARARTNFVSATAYELHREFCGQYLALMAPEGGKISDEEIMSFIEQRSASTGGPELVFDREAQRERMPRKEDMQALDLTEEGLNEKDAEDDEDDEEDWY